MSNHNLPDAEQLFAALKAQMAPAIARDAKLVGVYSGGAWLADRLAAELDGDHAVGYARCLLLSRRSLTSGLKANVRSTQILFRCRMRISFWSMTCCSPGAPYAQRSIRCSTLADRPRCNWRCWLTAVAREIPVAADYVGAPLIRGP